MRSLSGASRRRVQVVVACLLVLVPAWVGAQESVSPRPGAQAESEPSSAPEVVDRIVAVVDEDPIFYSEIEQALALGIVEIRPGVDREAALRQALDRLIEQRLRLHELDRFGGQTPAVEEVENQVGLLEQSLGGAAALDERLDQIRLTRTDLEQLLAFQLELEAFVRERLGPRVFVGLEDIRIYYDEELVPALRERGAEVPEIDAVREEIRAVLYEQRLNEALDAWTEELRGSADVRDFFDRSETEDVPLVGVRGR